MELSVEQIAELESCGRTIAEQWVEAMLGEGEPALDYNFDAGGDWQYVRECAQRVGIAWSDADAQPDTNGDEIWSAVKRGYQEIINQ
jgi:hypothetical protein